MELNTEIRLADVPNTFVATVVRIDEEFLPFRRQAGSIYCITVILGCDVTFPGQHVGARDVVSTITELHLQCARTSCSGQQLMTKTDAKDGYPVLLQCRGNVLNRLLHHGRVTRTVGDKETVIVLASKGWEVVIPWADHDFHAAFQEAAQLVIFQSNV